MIIKFEQIATEVQAQLNDVAARTLEKLKEMHPELAESINPVIPSADSLKWADVFKSVSISGDDGIPINKRGSGVKRLILLNFFRAEAERRKASNNIPSIIYAIEEPETSQHSEHQKKLIRAFQELSKSDKTQVIITTHSAPLVKELEFSNLRLVIDENGAKGINKVDPKSLSYSSLNEVNYLAFSEITEEYHNELYGYIELEGKLTAFKSENEKDKQYKQLLKNGRIKDQDITLTEYIRHQIHHPENTYNSRFTSEDLKASIELMRTFIKDSFSSSTQSPPLPKKDK